MTMVPVGWPQPPLEPAARHQGHGEPQPPPRIRSTGPIPAPSFPGDRRRTAGPCLACVRCTTRRPRPRQRADLGLPRAKPVARKSTKSRLLVTRALRGRSRHGFTYVGCPLVVTRHHTRKHHISRRAGGEAGHPRHQALGSFEGAEIPRARLSNGRRPDSISPAALLGGGWQAAFR